MKKSVSRRREGKKMDLHIYSQDEKETLLGEVQFVFCCTKISDPMPHLLSNNHGNDILIA